MRLIYLAVIFAVFIPGPVSAQSAKQKSKVEQEIRRLDLAHADAILRGDLAALDKLWTEDFKVNNPFNQVDRADRIRTGAVTYSSFIREPETVLIHGDTVIVMGREIVVPKGNSPDAGKTINRRYTNIWMKRSGRWRLVARHASVICQQ
ncbi:MAG TPA: nuclear transport factor 2 family protein [Pyrinomonadaceae bacterium]|nr:nuclear transport factor 2 family protein [Pyrinomonadaceae bacterium]